MFYCLMISGGSLTDPLRNLMLDTAQEMIAENRRRRTIKSGCGTGGITTKNERVSVGGFSGILFKAELDTERGSFKVAYIVHPSRDVRSTDGRWVTV